MTDYITYTDTMTDWGTSALIEPLTPAARELVGEFLARAEEGVSWFWTSADVPCVHELSALTDWIKAAQARGLSHITAYLDDDAMEDVAPRCAIEFKARDQCENCGRMHTLERCEHCPREGGSHD